MTRKCGNWIIFLILNCGCKQAASNGGLHFVVFGDWGKNNLGQREVAYALNEWADDHPVSFILSTGDNFYPEGVTSTHDPQWKTSWLDIYNLGNLVDVPWQVSLGNHDYGPRDGREWNQVAYSRVNSRWVMPDLWFTFTRPVGDSGASAQFFAVDTEALVNKVNEYQDMLSWLDSELAASYATWKIVFGHRPIYSFGNYGPWTKSAEQQLLPILQKHNVHVYFCGHDHNFQLIHDNDDPNIVFVVAGGGGGGTIYQFNRTAAAILDSQRNLELEFFASTYGFVAVDLTEDMMTLDFVDSTRNVVRSFARGNSR